MSDILQETIGNAEVVVAIFDRGANSNVFFELGFAQALKKRTLIVIDDDVDPPFIADVGATLLRTKLDNTQAIEVGICQLLKVPHPPTCLPVVDQTGAMQNNATVGEADLDVEWAYAIAPGASIVVYTAAPSFQDSMVPMEHETSPALKQTNAFGDLLDQYFAEVRGNVGPSPEMKSVVDQTASGDGPNDGDWSDELNELRIELIDKDIQGNITSGERAELAELQRKAVAYRDRVAPLPIEGARHLHQQLLEMKRQREGG